MPAREAHNTQHAPAMNSSGTPATLPIVTYGAKCSHLVSSQESAHHWRCLFATHIDFLFEPMSTCIGRAGATRRVQQLYNKSFLWLQVHTSTDSHTVPESIKHLEVCNKKPPVIQFTSTGLGVSSSLVQSRGSSSVSS